MDKDLGSMSVAEHITTSGPAAFTRQLLKFGMVKDQATTFLKVIYELGNIPISFSINFGSNNWVSEFSFELSLIN